MKIPVTRPSIGEDEQRAVAEVLASGFLVQGPRVEEFERLVAERVGVRHAVALTNCTAALATALRSLGVGPGDEVVVAPYSWPATANVVELCGARPIFVDVCADTFNLDAASLSSMLSAHPDLERVKAVMPVHTFGNPAGITEVTDVAGFFGVPVVEDAACALGSSIDGRAAGAFGAVGCFSFHPRKIITTGEGGRLVTDDPDVAAFARTYRNHGQAGSPSQFVAAGDNLRLTELQGALGVVQMGKLDRLVASRAELAERYDELLAPFDVVPQRRAPGAAVQSYVVQVPPAISAFKVIQHLRSLDVEATIGTIAIPFTPHHRQEVDEATLPVLASLQDRVVTLPLFPGMPEPDQSTVVRLLSECLECVT
jgi:perosamine synthetase